MDEEYDAIDLGNTTHIPASGIPVMLSFDKTQNNGSTLCEHKILHLLY